MQAYTFAAVTAVYCLYQLAGCSRLAEAACWAAGCMAACWAATLMWQACRYLISPCVFNNVYRWP